MIPQIDLQAQYLALQPEIDEALLKVAGSGRYILGPNVQELETRIADYCGAAHAVGVASGTDALRLSLTALGIGPGNEVITTPFTFMATADSIAHTGATPIFVDIDPRTFNIDATRLAAAITAKTKAILPVHLFGQPADMSTIMDIANRHNLAVVEDCAQALGAEWNGHKVGSFGSTGAFSFFPTKNLGGLGDGGMVVTNDAMLAEKIRILRQHGTTVKYHHEQLGYNSRLDEIQAAILLVKMKYLDSWTEARQRIAALYDSLIKADKVITPFVTPGVRHVFNQYTIRHPDRDALAAHLAKHDISSAVYYPLSLAKQTALAYLKPGLYPLEQADLTSREVLSLPMYPELTDDAVGTVAETVNSFKA